MPPLKLNILKMKVISTTFSSSNADEKPCNKLIYVTYILYRGMKARTIKIPAKFRSITDEEIEQNTMRILNWQLQTNVDTILQKYLYKPRAYLISAWQSCLRAALQRDPKTSR